MSLFVLDTDVFSLFLRGNEFVCQHFVQAAPHTLAVTIITVEECLTGWYSEIRRARRDADLLRAYASLHQTHDILRDLPVLPFEENALNTFHKLRKSHRRLARNGLRIAAIAVNHSGTSVTSNLRDFVEIPGLSVTDWSRPPQTES